jgi:hypothetical protein
LIVLAEVIVRIALDKIEPELVKEILAAISASELEKITALSWLLIEAILIVAVAKDLIEPELFNEAELRVVEKTLWKLPELTIELSLLLSAELVLISSFAPARTLALLLFIKLLAVIFKSEDELN